MSPRAKTTMTKPADSWYVRLPDGRVLRASSTRAVRHHIRHGRIPLDSRVRRSGYEEWSALEWTSEFAELVRSQRLVEAEDVATTPPPPGEPGGIAARMDSLQLQTVGVRGFVEELLAALDS